MFCHFWQKFENSKWPPFLGREKFFENFFFLNIFSYFDTDHTAITKVTVYTLAGKWHSITIGLIKI